MRSKHFPKIYIMERTLPWRRALFDRSAIHFVVVGCFSHLLEGNMKQGRDYVKSMLAFDIRAQLKPPSVMHMCAHIVLEPNPTYVLNP